jgi:hypothetical protein
MLQLSPDAIATIVVFIAAQTGALIFFAGVVAFTLKNHDRRLTTNETDCKECRRTVIQLATKEGIEL